MRAVSQPPLVRFLSVLVLLFGVLLSRDLWAEGPPPTEGATTALGASAGPGEVAAPVTPLGIRADRGLDRTVDWPGRMRSGFGLLVMILIAFGLSVGRKDVRWRLVAIGVGLQIILGLLTLSPPGAWLFTRFNDLVVNLLNFTAEGSKFLFGNLALQNNVPVGPSVIPPPEAAAGDWANAWQSVSLGAPQDPGGPARGWAEAAKMVPIAKPEGAWAWANVGAYFAFGVLPTIIFFSSLMAVLYHLGVMQKLVHAMAWVMQRSMGTSGAESLSAAGNIFVGQTEAPLLVRPFVGTMTLSELMAVMTGGFATVAGGVMAAYVGMLRGVFPDIAGHLLTASIMSAPAALVCAKIMVPEPDPERCETYGKLKIDLESTDANVIDAAARGASEGLRLALNVGAMLLAFIALIAMLNALIGWFGALVGFEQLTMERLLGWVLAPLAWIMGVPWADAITVGSLLGVKTVLNEFVAYLQLSGIASGLSSYRSMVIVTYALCGFANFASIAIQIGGISGIAPERRSDLARIGLRAMIAGNLAAFMTACVIGMLT